MFDELARAVAERSGIGSKVDTLIAGLLELVFDEQQGGMAGLIARFRLHAGPETVAEWIGNPDARTSARILTATLGAATLEELGERADIPAQTVAQAGALLLPALIGRLTPEGRLPINMPLAVAGYLRRFAPLNEPSAACRIPALHSRWLRWSLLLASVVAFAHFMLHHVPGHVPAVPSTTSAVPITGHSTRWNPDGGVADQAISRQITLAKRPVSRSRRQE